MRFLIRGFDKATARERNVVVDALTEDNAVAEASRRGVITESVTQVHTRRNRWTSWGLAVVVVVLVSFAIFFVQKRTTTAHSLASDPNKVASALAAPARSVVITIEGKNLTGDKECDLRQMWNGTCSRSVRQSQPILSTRIIARTLRRKRRHGQRLWRTSPCSKPN